MGSRSAGACTALHRSAVQHRSALQRSTALHRTIAAASAAAAQPTGSSHPLLLRSGGCFPRKRVPGRALCDVCCAPAGGGRVSTRPCKQTFHFPKRLFVRSQHEPRALTGLFLPRTKIHAKQKCLPWLLSYLVSFTQTRGVTCCIHVGPGSSLS